jgi:hypothetical protein
MSRSSTSPSKRRGIRPPTIDLDDPRFVFLPFFKSRLRAIIDGGSTWCHYEDVMNLPDLEGAARSMHQRQRLVRRVIAKWNPFFERMRKYPVLSESDFFRLLYATQRITGGLSLDLEKDPMIDKLAHPGGDFEAHELEFFRIEFGNRLADWRKDKTGSARMDDWNESA